MAQEEVVKILRVETQGSERTVKGLKNEIKNLRDALLNCEQGSEQYNRIIEQITQNQNDLSTAMNAGKQKAEALEGSYNYLVQTMAELKTQWRATTDEVARGEIGNQIADINNKLKELDAGIGNYQRNVGNYAGGFAEAMKEQQQSTEMTRAKLESLSKIASGLAGGYAAVQGVTALLGVENEKLEQTFIKLQAAIAIAQGVGGLKDLVEGVGVAKVAFGGAFTAVRTFIGGLTAMKAAMVTTGIGALVVALGLLIQYLVESGDEAENARKEIDELAKSYEKAKNSLSWANTKVNTDIYKQYVDDVKKAGDNVDKLRQAEEKRDKAIKEQQLSNAKEAMDIAKANANKLTEKRYSSTDLSKEDFDNLAKEEEQARKEAADAELEYNKLLAESAQETADAKIEADNKVRENEKKLAEERQKEAEQRRKEKEQQDKAAAAQKKADEAKAEQQRKADEEKARRALMQGHSTSMSQIGNEENFRQQEIENKYNSMGEASTPSEQIQLEINKLSELRTLRIEMHNEEIAQIDATLQSQILSDEERKKLETEKANMIRQNAIDEQKFINQTAALQKQKTKEQEKIEKAKRTATLNIAKQTFGALGDMVKEDSVTHKALAIASTTIDTYQSATAAYKAYAGINQPLAIAAAAAAVASGLANVKKIMSVDAENGETGSGGSTGSVTPTFNAEQAMPIEYTRNLLTSTETDELNQPQRVYVVESDITETQNKVKVTESNATF